jgi:intracellular multiplication protein IcmO
MAELKGITRSQEQDAQQLIKDTDSIIRKFIKFLKTNDIIYWLLAFVPIMMYFPNSSIVLSPFLLLWASKIKARPSETPFKKPKSSHELDSNEIHPGTGKPMDAEGIHYFGNEIGTGSEIWFSNSDVRTHALLFGTTGAGKTEALLGFCYNSLVQGSGFIYVDGKGDNSVMAKIFSLCRRLGRDDDLMIINFMTGGINLNQKSTKRLSNTMNPFVSAPADPLSELVASLMSTGDGGADMWAGRANIFMKSLLTVLVALRDSGKLLLDVDTIRKYFILEALEDMIFNFKLLDDTRYEMGSDVTEDQMAGLKDFLVNLPGFKKTYDNNNQFICGKQDGTTNEQHGYITMQFTEVFGMLSDTYGHIMKTQLGEVDFYDIVVNRRILFVLLPALEKSPQNLSNLGKIIVSSVRAMMATSLGAELEGDRSDIIERKPTNAPMPYMCIFDEFGYYAVEGSAVMAAQARSLGFAMIFAGQDYQAFQKSGKEEAASIVANCAIKMCMKLEDPAETLEIFNKAAGEANIATTDRLDRQGSGFQDSNQISIKKESRINSRDLKAQIAGEMHIIFGDTLVRAKTFFINPHLTDQMRMNTFLKVKPPKTDILVNRHKTIHKIKNSLLNFSKTKTYTTKLQKLKKSGGSIELINRLETAILKSPGNKILASVNEKIRSAGIASDIQAIESALIAITKTPQIPHHLLIPATLFYHNAIIENSNMSSSHSTASIDSAIKINDTDPLSDIVSKTSFSESFMNLPDDDDLEWVSSSDASDEVDIITIEEFTHNANIYHKTEGLSNATASRQQTNQVVVDMCHGTVGANIEVDPENNSYFAEEEDLNSINTE